MSRLTRMKSLTMKRFNLSTMFLRDAGTSERWVTAIGLWRLLGASKHLQRKSNIAIVFVGDQVWATNSFP